VFLLCPGKVKAMNNKIDLNNKGFQGPVLLGISIVGVVFVLSIAYRVYKGKPIFRPEFEEVHFFETWQSGWSNRDWLTRLGGARNCLWIAVTQDALWISPHFPFNLFFIPEAFHLDYRIPGEAVREFTRRSSGDETGVVIRFRHATGQEDSFEFTVKDFQKFQEAMKQMRGKP